MICNSKLKGCDSLKQSKINIVHECSWLLFQINLLMQILSLQLLLIMTRFYCMKISIFI